MNTILLALAEIVMIQTFMTLSMCNQHLRRGMRKPGLRT